MGLQLEDKIHARRMHEHFELGHGKSGKYLEFEEEIHAHNVYHKDKHHHKIGMGL